MVVTTHELWVRQAPNTNFEYNEISLLAKALEVGFVRKVGDDAYEINEEYGNE